MGVDYSAVFGIGVVVHTPEDYDDDPYEYFEELLDGTPYSYGESGSGSYSGNDNTHYIFIDEPFKEGMLEFLIKVTEFDKFLNDKNIDYDGDIDLVGDLHVW